jgi:hypothetical protein
LPPAVAPAPTQPSGASWQMKFEAPSLAKWGPPPHETAYSLAAHTSRHVAVPDIDVQPAQLVGSSEMQPISSPLAPRGGRSALAADAKGVGALNVGASDGACAGATVVQARGPAAVTVRDGRGVSRLAGSRGLGTGFRGSGVAETGVAERRGVGVRRRAATARAPRIQCRVAP